MKLSYLNFITFILLISISNSIIEFQETVEPSQQFRGVWSSPWGGDADLITFHSEEQFKKDMNYILDTLKMYNMNSIIYHVRTHDDALYQSELNPISPYFKDVDYKKFDPLKWMIDESHRRGIDFHAWMNPYRISSNKSLPIEDILEKYQNYQKNPASDRDCILYGTNSIIMDPGLEKVRTFIADTIIEFLNKYDVEAIHFDDYFYADMGAKGATSGNYTILDEADQKTYNDYINNNPDCGYKNDSATDKANWRRYQVDLLIVLLKEKISEYNKNNSKYVQLGISPTGVYKNGDGNVTYDKDGTAITTGSETKAQEHYSSYLFCDTLKWCNEGWIDYILPQSYWAFDHPLAGYEKVMGWWDKVLLYKKVNLFSGIGLYMSDLTGNTYGWQKNTNELYDQLNFDANGQVIDGASIYNFHTLRNLRDGKDTISAQQIKNGVKAWMKRVPPSELKAFEKVELKAPQNLRYDGTFLSFDEVKGAKFYAIYQSKNEIEFTEDEIVDIVGNPDNTLTINWKENKNDNYKYGVKAISYTNTLGEGNKDCIKVEEKEQEFRGVWSSPWGGDADLITFHSEEQFKKDMNYILDTLKMYNMNSIIYHVRTHDDALYQSELNPISPYFKDVDYKKFDPLKWMIDESHRRGIDFHAWMNPYRISSNKSLPIEDILEKYQNYQKNPASDRDCILYGTNSIIMDPGLEKVRTFIADTIIEFLNKYDVEAIHFDDYFYADMGAKGATSGNYTILDEADQKTYNDYINNNPDCGYKNDSATDKANWRRYQVDLLIVLLKEKIDKYNQENHKHVQFGISPTGIWRNGDGIVTYDENGTAITTGSDTSGQQHWGDYLFCDTLKWCNEGWIDYILPQNYFARNNPNAPFGKVIDWWDKVLKNKKVNSYQGVGLYQADEEKRNRYSWQTDYFELYKDLQDGLYSNRTQGISIYNLHTLRSLRDGLDKISSKQIENGMKAWTKRVPLAEIKTFESIMLDAPKNVKFQNSILSFDKVEDAKFYIIYKNQEEIKFITDEIIDMLGNPENKTRVEWKDSKKGNYKYGVRALSYSNTLGNTTTDVEYLPDSNSSSKTNIGPFMALFLLIVLVF